MSGSRLAPNSSTRITIRITNSQPPRLGMVHVLPQVRSSRESTPPARRAVLCGTPRPVRPVPTPPVRPADQRAARPAAEPPAAVASRRSQPGPQPGAAGIEPAPPPAHHQHQDTSSHQSDPGDRPAAGSIAITYPPRRRPRPAPPAPGGRRRRPAPAAPAAAPRRRARAPAGPASPGRRSAAAPGPGRRRSSTIVLDRVVLGHPAGLAAPAPARRSGARRAAGTGPSDTSVGSASGGGCGRLVEHHDVLHPVQPEQPHRLGAPAPGLQVAAAVDDQQPHRVDRALETASRPAV